jgi:biotin-dependent carboxylase-like uncharacterized protein
MVDVIKSGFYTTIQDLGRSKYLNIGVPVSGVMDQYSSKLANKLLDNTENDAVLEVTMVGPELKFLNNTFICITGADLSPKLNNLSLKLNSVIRINTNDVLSFGKLKQGYRCYIAIKGGFISEDKLGSKSMFKPITETSVVSTGDQISYNTSLNFNLFKNSKLKYNAFHFETKIIEVFEGPEFDNLTENQKQMLFSQEFSISNTNNRMAYQLNEVFKNSIDQIITSLILPGTVQLTPDGNLIILMRDAQTTGGYPRILQLKEQAINCLSQKFTGNKIQFKKVQYL